MVYLKSAKNCNLGSATTVHIPVPSKSGEENCFKEGKGRGWEGGGVIVNKEFIGGIESLKSSGFSLAEL